MDFLDPKKKRSHRTRLFIGYGLIAIAITIATLILVYATSGYGFDSNKRAIVQNGLVFVSAHPEAATVHINGQDRGGTDGRYVLEEGKYTLELKRDGYRSWKRDFVLEGSSVERFIYPFLFPQQLVSKDLTAFNTVPDMVTESPDRHWIVIHQPETFNSFLVIDANTKENAAASITVPATILVPRPGTQTLEMVEWSTDNRHVLIKHSYTGGSDFIMLDRENPASSVNINNMLGHSFAQIALKDKRHDQVYGYDANGLLQSVDLKTGTLNPVSAHVDAFFPYGSNTLLYVTKQGAPADKVLVKIQQGESTYTLRTLPVSPLYLLNMAEFDRKLYAAVGTSAESRLYVYQDPIGLLRKGSFITPPIKALLKVDSGAEYVSFSANARFVAVQGGSKFAVYDAENNRQFRYDTGLQLAEHTKATWMDGHRLNLTSQNKLHVFDFDGTNRQELNAVHAGTKPMFDRDYTALFTLSPSVNTPSKSGIVRTELLVKKQ
jgi:hypothetical protein